MNPHTNYGYAVLTANALRAPDKVAISFDGAEELTHDQLNRAVNRRAHQLTAAGARAGEPMAALLHSTRTITEVYLAAAKLGVVTAAMNPYWPEETLIAVLQRSGCRAFAYDAHHDDLIARIKGKLDGVHAWVRLAEDDGAQAASEAEPALGAGGDDPLAYFYTSGTTGLPKAVIHTHASSISTAQLWLDLPKDRDSVFATGPIIWGIGFTAIAGPALYGGVRLALQNDFGPGAFLTVAPREQVTHISVIPSFFSQLLAADHAGADLSSLRVILLGGEPLLPSLLAQIRSRLPAADIYTYYGQTEAPYTCLDRLDDSRDVRSSGRARTTCAVRVVNTAGDRVLDEVGEIQLSGPHLMTGYAGLPDALRDGWYVGGDLGTLDADGVLTVLGRREDAIHKQGVWTQPSTVEEAAMSLDGVAEAGAVGLGEPGTDQRILLAVAPRPGATLEAATIVSALAERLPAASRPDTVVVADELPHAEDASGGKGKLLRREIRDRWGD